MQIWGSVKKCQNYRFLDIFWDILDKRKSYLHQECVKRGFLSLLSKTGKIAHDFSGKMRVLALLFHLSLPKIWLSPLYKIYDFGLSYNRVFR